MKACAESKCAKYENALGQPGPSSSQPSPSQPASSNRSSRAGSVTIAYSSGWSDAYIHYQRADGCALLTNYLCWYSALCNDCLKSMSRRECSQLEQLLASISGVHLSQSLSNPLCFTCSLDRCARSAYGHRPIQTRPLRHNAPGERNRVCVQQRRQRLGLTLQLPKLCDHRARRVPGAVRSCQQAHLRPSEALPCRFSVTRAEVCWGDDACVGLPRLCE